MTSIETLIEALALCVPLLDPKPLLADTPDDLSQEAVLEWMYNHLQDQDRMVYEEWKEYFGELPALGSLTGLDLGSYDNSFVVSLVSQLAGDDEEALAGLLPSELPYLEYINSFLVRHGLRLVDLLPFENAYIFCVEDDPALLNRLDTALANFKMRINRHEPLNAGQTRTYIEELLAS